MRLCSTVVALVVVTTGVLELRPQAATPQAVAPARQPDVIYLPTRPDVVARMLALAQVGPGDVVFDLGSGDGRIVIAAVRDFGASLGFGVELDAARVRDAIEIAARAGVSDRVFFLNQDLFQADLSTATVVTLYLLPAVNQRLAAKLRTLRPGTRIVSHDYPLTPDWLPDRIERVTGGVIYVFTVKRP
jgi:SAM-dependent methyltransferase